jgi:pimeloyl-ACP methyl ester carboxylesterase
MVMATAVETINMYTCMMRDRPDRLEMWKNADVPSLIVAGKYDEFIPLGDLQEQAAELPSCDFQVLNQSGHLGMWEEQDRSVEILTGFLG